MAILLYIQQSVGSVAASGDIVIDVVLRPDRPGRAWERAGRIQDEENPMTKLDDHPSVVRFRQSEPHPRPGRIDVERLRRICLDAGADDVGLVAIDRPELDEQRDAILGQYPEATGQVLHIWHMYMQPGTSP